MFTGKRMGTTVAATSRKPKQPHLLGIETVHYKYPMLDMAFPGRKSDQLRNEDNVSPSLVVHRCLNTTAI